MVVAVSGFSSFQPRCFHSSCFHRRICELMGGNVDVRVEGVSLRCGD